MKERNFQMTKQEISRHIIQDRMERMVLIATTIGYGNIVREFVTDGKFGKIRQCITDTGVMILKECETDKVITLYAITIDRLIATYRAEAPNERVPQYLYKTVLNNQKKRPYLFNVNK
jgi:hypothetical protein